MVGLKDFVVQINEKYSDKFHTNSGVDIYGDRRFNAKELANTVVKVRELPLNYTGPIKKGSRLLIDPTVVLNQMYQKGGEQENTKLLDRERKLYKIEPEMIIAYCVEGGELWRGFGRNFLGSRILEEPKPVSSIIASPVPQKPIKVMGRVKVAVLNDFMEEQGAKRGDEVFINEYSAIDIQIGEGDYVWLNNSEALAIA